MCTAAPHRLYPSEQADWFAPQATSPKRRCFFSYGKCPKCKAMCIVLSRWPLHGLCPLLVFVNSPPTDFSPFPPTPPPPGLWHNFIFMCFFFCFCLFLILLFCIGIWPVNSVVIVSGDSRGTQPYACVHSPPSFPPIQAATATHLSWKHLTVCLRGPQCFFACGQHVA